MEMGLLDGSSVNVTILRDSNKPDSYQPRWNDNIPSLVRIGQSDQLSSEKSIERIESSLQRCHIRRKRQSRKPFRPKSRAHHQGHMS